MAAARADRLLSRYVTWLTRGVFLCIVAGLAILAGMLLSPAISWLVETLAALLVVAGFACFMLAIVSLVRWFIARRAFYHELPPARRRIVHQSELRNRGAPAWYLRAPRQGRIAYVLASFVVASLLVAGPVIFLNSGHPDRSSLIWSWCSSLRSSWSSPS